MKRFVVSACLAGEPCRYDGKSNLCQPVRALMDKGDALALCPEVLGGLPTPRIPSEICSCAAKEQRLLVHTKTGQDVTASFVLGAQKALALALEAGCEVAIVKSRSPSCGARGVYDGSFSKKLVTGQGVWAGMLRDAGLAVYTEEEFLAL